MGQKNPLPKSEERDYESGFEEGARSTLMEVLSFISKGHTASELRFLAETKLSHLSDASREHRPPIFSMPTTVPKSSILPSRFHSEAVETERSIPDPLPGYSYLFLEEDHSRGRQFLDKLRAKTLPTVILTRLPQEFAESGPNEHQLTLVVGTQGEEASEKEGLSGVRQVGSELSSITGLMNRFLEKEGPQVGCYVEALEYFVTEKGFDQSLRLVHWLNSAVLSKKGVLALSTDDGTLSNIQLRNLKVDFNLSDG